MISDKNKFSPSIFLFVLPSLFIFDVVDPERVSRDFGGRHVIRKKTNSLFLDWIKSDSPFFLSLEEGGGYVALFDMLHWPAMDVAFGMIVPTWFDVFLPSSWTHVWDSSWNLNSILKNASKTRRVFAPGKDFSILLTLCSNTDK